MSPRRIALVSLARPTFDLALARQVTDMVRSGLAARGYTLVGPPEMIADQAAAEAAAAELGAAKPEPDLLVVLQATFADSRLLVTLAEACAAPLFLWAVPEEPTGDRLRLNSLCGINLGGHALRLRQRRYAYAYAPPEDEAVYDRIAAVALAGRTRRRLRAARIGIVGRHPDGMDSCHLDPEQLESVLGVTIREYALGQLFTRMSTIGPTETDPIRQRLATRLPNLPNLEPKAVSGTLSAYAALQELAAADALDALAIRCWPEFFEAQSCAACGAMSLLSDALTPASCEADANGVLTQLILQWLSDAPAFDADLVSVDEKEDFAVVWHCGKAPLSMAAPARPPQAGLHSNRRVPLVMEFALKPGRVTVARLSRATGALRLVVGGGEMVAGPPSFSGTSGRLRFDRPAAQVLDTILSQGLEHHIALTYGDCQPALLALAEMLELPVLSL